jgi:esterase/lipase
MDYNPIFEDQQNVEKDYPAGMMPVSFMSSGDKLLGTMFIAHGKGPHPTVLLLHGFPGNENNFDLAHIIRRLGWNVLVFHYRGSWGSDGEYSFKNSLEDTSVAIDFLRAYSSNAMYRCDPEKIVLIGHSLGGFSALMKSADDDSIQNAASLAGFNFGFLANLISGNNEAKKIAMDYLTVGVNQLSGTSADKLLDEMMENADNWNLLNKIGELSQKNLLLICSTYDSIASPEIHHLPFVGLLEGVGSKNLSQFELKTGHSFSDKRIKLAEHVIEWLNNIKF